MTPEDQVDIKAFFNSLIAERVPVEKARAFCHWVARNVETWKRFERIAFDKRNAGEEWTAKRIVENELRPVLKTFIPNNATAYLARMFNFKYRCRYFETQPVRGFSERNAA